MTVHLRAERTKLHWLETTRCLVSLENRGSEVVTNVNPANSRGSATLLLLDLDSGETMRFFEEPFDPTVALVCPPPSVEPGRSLEDSFSLTRRLRFPRPGRYELRAHFGWDGGEAQSDSVGFEIAETEPRSLSIASAKGGPSSYTYCAWVDRQNGGGSLWLAPFNTVPTPCWLGAVRLAELPLKVSVALSVPPNSIPTRQYAGWIVGRELHYAIHEHGAVENRTIGLDAEGYEIIQPILEDPFENGVSPGAEALLMKRSKHDWMLRVVRLNGGESSESVVRVGGIAPAWASTAYRSNGERLTFFLQPALQSGGIALSGLRWQRGERLVSPEKIGEWSGRLLGSTLSVMASDRIIGALVLDSGHSGQDRYRFQVWSISGENRFEPGVEYPLRWEAYGPVERAIVRIGDDGEPCAFLKPFGSTVWHIARADGRVVPHPELKLGRGAPADIVFGFSSVPVVLYADAQRGLQWYASEAITPMSPPVSKPA